MDMTRHTPNRWNFTQALMTEPALTFVPWRLHFPNIRHAMTTAAFAIMLVSSTVNGVEPIAGSGVAGGLAVLLCKNGDSAATILEDFKDKPSFVAQALITNAEEVPVLRGKLIQQPAYVNFQDRHQFEP